MPFGILVIELAAEPVHILSLREISTRSPGERDRIIKCGMLPVERQLNVFVEKPVDPGVPGADAVRKEGGIRQLVGKHVIAQSQSAVSRVEFERSQTFPIRSRWLDAAPPGGNLLAGEEIASRDRKTGHRNLRCAALLDLALSVEQGISLKAGVVLRIDVEALIRPHGFIIPQSPRAVLDGRMTGKWGAECQKGGRN